MEKIPSDRQEIKVSPTYRIGVYLFVSIYFSVAFITLLPKSPLQSRLITMVSPLTHSFNLMQNWKLFCPELREINFYSQAVVEFADGATKYYEFPRLEEMPAFEAYRRQKLCKLFQDSMPWPDFAAFWPDVGRFIARANLDPCHPSNQPVQVSLSYNWVPVGNINQYEKQADLKDPNRRYTFFIYRVQPEDLQ